jgi:hypothetical protein
MSEEKKKQLLTVAQELSDIQARLRRTRPGG